MTIELYCVILDVDKTKIMEKLLNTINLEPYNASNVAKKPRHGTTGGQSKALDYKIFETEPEILKNEPEYKHLMELSIELGVAI